jgi:hypothetical protein
MAEIAISIANLIFMGVTSACRKNNTAWEPKESGASPSAHSQTALAFLAVC